jgi:peptidoglycan L-alanyl-D-glutamate endopeptidase CwlK
MAKGFKFSARSLRELEGIHPDLRKVTDLALELSEVDFIITDGKRTLAEQKKHVANGASKTMRSRHLTGHAVDYVAYVKADGNKMKISYSWSYMKKVADAFKAASATLKIPVDWGGDWKKFKDSPHIELKKSVYPG